MADKEEIYQEWFKKAREDELTVSSILKHRDGTPSVACFLSQQMAEKYLKGLLVFHKQEFPKIHDLKRIATLLEFFVSDIFELDDELTVLNKYYIITRYPGDYPEFSWDEAQKAYTSANKIKEFVLRKIK